MISTNLKNRWPLLLLIAIHACILFYDFSNIPFYHDELSAIERCRFNGFHDLISKGVMVDGHPAGVHLFLYSMIRLFGIHEWILKLPFLLAGIGSLILLYRTGEALFGKYAAIATGVFFIFLSYYISQIIVVRPYIPGLFFALGAFYHGIRIRQSPHKKYRYILFGLFSVGGMYSHYFSHLQIMLIWLALPVFFPGKIHLRYYLIAVAFAILCFLPHIAITYHQLGMGGLGWLAKPDFRFFTDFFYRYFNSGIPTILSASILFILSILVKTARIKFKMLCILLFIIPCAILFVYSLIIAPVLQAPALYFCSPFLLLFIGNGINYFDDKFKPLLIILLMILNAYELIIHNQYYTLRNYQPMEKFVLGCKTRLSVDPNLKTLILWAGNSRYLNYFIDKHHFKHPVMTTDTLQDIRKINFSGYDEVICNQLPPVYFHTLEKHFPNVASTENNLLYSLMVLKRKDVGQKLFTPPVKLIFNFDSGKEWSQTSYSFEIKKLVTDRYRFVEFIPYLDSVVKGAELVLETYDGTERIDWRSIYLEPDNVLSIKLKDVIHSLESNYTLKIYIWNSGKVLSGPIRVDMVQRADNPWEYVFKIPE